MEGEDRDFWRAVEAYGEGYDSNAGIGVELQIADLVMAERILASEVGEDGSAEKRDADLTAMGMSGELEIDGVLADPVGHIGFVYEENAGIIGRDLGHGAAEIRSVLDGVVHTGDPKPGTTGFEGDGIVPQNANAAVGQGGGDKVRVGGVVVIAEDSNGSQAGPEPG